MSRPSSILFVGNSYFGFNNGVGWHVAQMHRSTGAARPLRSTSALITGASLAWHDVEGYFRPGAIGSYVFDESNNVVRTAFEPLFDVVLMADCSRCPVHPDLAAEFQATAARQSAVVRRHGAEPALFMTWANADQPEMTAPLAAAYDAAGRANGARVIPAGLAFAQALSQRPELHLHIADKSHPSLAGTYLAACCVYAAFFGTLADIAYDGELAWETAVFLRRIAGQTVADYLPG